MQGKSRLPNIIGFALMIIGAALLLWPAWQYIYAHYHQTQLLADFRESSSSAQEPESLPGEDVSDGGTFAIDADDRPAVKATPVDSAAYDLENDGPFLIRIDALGIELPVVYGVEPENLSVAPGFYPQGVGPGEVGNMAIAGHRTTYGAPFRHLDSLEEGDHIVIASPKAEYVYVVEEIFVVGKYAWEVIDPTPEPKLTLTTCHPVGSAAERLVVRAGYVESGSAADDDGLSDR